MSEGSQNRDKDVWMIDIEVKESASIEKIEEQIDAKLRSRNVKDFLCKRGDEVVIRLMNEGNHG
jgi:hypothetical protein